MVPRVSAKCARAWPARPMTGVVTHGGITWVTSSPPVTRRHEKETTDVGPLVARFGATRTGSPRPRPLPLPPPVTTPGPCCATKSLHPETVTLQALVKSAHGTGKSVADQDVAKPAFLKRMRPSTEIVAGGSRLLAGLTSHPRRSFGRSPCSMNWRWKRSSKKRHNDRDHLRRNRVERSGSETKRRS